MTYEEKKKIPVKILSLAFYLLCLHAGVAHAQTYVRPSDGATINLFSNGAYTAGTLTSTTFNMSGFQGAVFFLRTDKDNCAELPRVEVQASSFSSSFSGDVPAPAVNATHIPINLLNTTNPNDNYVVAPLFSFVRVKVFKVTNPATIVGPPNVCTVTLNMIPLSFVQTPGGVSQQSGGQNFAANTVTLIAPTALSTYRRFRLQNTSTSTVYCGDAFIHPILAPPNNFLLYGFALAPATGPDQGDGGSILLNDFAGFMYCFSTAVGGGKINYMVW